MRFLTFRLRIYGDADKTGQSKRPKLETLVVKIDIAMPRYNTTLMGVVKGGAGTGRMNMSDAMLFGRSGHAFLINIHETLCPSGPYCWNRQSFDQLLRKMGILTVDLWILPPCQQHVGSPPFGGRAQVTDR